MSTNTIDFGQLLDDSLQQISSGASTLEDCLARHPEDAAELRPLLQSAGRLLHAAASWCLRQPTRNAGARMLRIIRARTRGNRAPGGCRRSRV